MAPNKGWVFTDNSPSFWSADPMEWSTDHVSQWLSWAEKEFAFSAIERSGFKLSGAQLCSLSREEFLRRAPPYTGDVLLSHFNLLRARAGEWQLTSLRTGLPPQL